MSKAVLHVTTLWGCACGHQWFSAKKPSKCPKCGVKRKKEK